MKYAVLLLAMMFVGVATPSMAQKLKAKPKVQVSQKLTFEFEGKTIEVAEKDFAADMNWDDALSACQNLGNGWRLPNRDELEAMYEQLHKQGKGNFKTKYWHWSSSKYRRNDVWFIYFADGEANNTSHYRYGKYYTGYVRAVRTLRAGTLTEGKVVPTEAAFSTVGYEIKIDGSIIQVAKEDFPTDVDWEDAMIVCENLGNGWRLPNRDELEAMYELLHKQGKGNFKTDDLYWGTSEGLYGNIDAWRFDFESGKAYDDYTHYLKSSTRHVRAVRALP